MHVNLPAPPTLEHSDDENYISFGAFPSYSSLVSRRQWPSRWSVSFMALFSSEFASNPSMARCKTLFASHFTAFYNVKSFKKIHNTF